MPTNNSIIKTFVKRIFRSRLQFSPRIFFNVFYRLKMLYSKTSFIGTLIYQDLHLSGSRNLIYRDILFLLQPPLLVHSDIVSRCFICRSFIMSIFYIPSFVFLSSFSIIKNQINLHNLQIHYNLCTRALFALYITITK